MVSSTSGLTLVHNAVSSQTVPKGVVEVSPWMPATALHMQTIIIMYDCDHLLFQLTVSCSRDTSAGLTHFKKSAGSVCIAFYDAALGYEVLAA